MSQLSTNERQNFDKRFAAIRSVSPDEIIATNERFQQSITDVKAGGVIRLRKKTYLVQEVSRYDETDENFKKKKKFSAHELKLCDLESGQTVNIEWEVDDEVEISLTTRVLTFRDLQDDEGESIDEDDIEKIANDEDDEEPVYVSGHADPFYYDDDWAARYYRGGGSRDGLKVYFYEFENEKGVYLTVEEWIEGTGGDADVEYELFLSESVDPSELEIISLGK